VLPFVPFFKNYLYLFFFVLQAPYSRSRFIPCYFISSSLSLFTSIHLNLLGGLSFLLFFFFFFFFVFFPFFSLSFFLWSYGRFVLRQLQGSFTAPFFSWFFPGVHGMFIREPFLRFFFFLFFSPYLPSFFFFSFPISFFFCLFFFLIFFLLCFFPSLPPCSYTFCFEFCSFSFPLFPLVFVFLFCFHSHCLLIFCLLCHSIQITSPYSFSLFFLFDALCRQSYFIFYHFFTPLRFYHVSGRLCCYFRMLNSVSAWKNSVSVALSF